MYLSWNIEGEKQFSRKLNGLSSSVKNLKKPFEDSAKMLMGVFSKDAFSTKGAIFGEVWPKLSPLTIKQKQRLGFGSEPLINTGDMQRGFRSVVAKDHAIISNSVEYFQYHQSNKPRRKIPRRVMMKLGEHQKEEVVRIFQRYFHETLKK